MRHILPLIFSILPQSALAYETDQFTLPPEPLADVGEQIEALVRESLEETARKANDKISRAMSRARTEEAAKWRTSEQLAPLFFRSMRGGVELAEKLEILLAGKWKRAYRPESVRFNPTILGSIYGRTLDPRNALSMVRFSSTMRVFGVDLGTDKFGHFFKQGRQYFDVYLRARKNGRADPEARIEAFRRVGQGTENSFFGRGLTGVYSNADLASNYAGMKFYIHLREPMKLGDLTFEPMLRVNAQGLLEVNARDRQPMFARFVSEHMSEAYNPSDYGPLTTRLIESAVERRCEEWRRRYPEMTLETERARAERVKTYFGEAYGHHGQWDELVTVGRVCLEKQE